MQNVIGQRSRRKRIWIVTVVMIIILCALFIANICLGSVSIAPSEIWDVLSDQSGNETFYNIVWKIRLPRMFGAALLGGALALSGFLLQTFFNNPIASPFILGVSSGAKFAVAVLMIIVLKQYRQISSATLVVFAFIGALLTMGFVILIARRVENASMLIVCGVMIGYIFSAATDFVVTFADEAGIVRLQEWSRGSFSSISWENVHVIAIVVFATTALVFLLSKPLSAYQLGESYAKSVGLNIKLFRTAIVFLASLLAACATAFAGPISFVGMAVPHVVRLLLKTAKPIVIIPLCFLGGAIFCLGCDLVARCLFAPTELNIGAVTAVFAAPIVILIMLQRKRQA